MEFFELYDRIINKDLRPHKFTPDAESLIKIVATIYYNPEEMSEYQKYLEKSGKPYTITVRLADTGEKISEELRNTEYEELIDIDVPPPPDKKGEEFLDLIESEQIRNELMINKFIKESNDNDISSMAIKCIQNLNQLWDEFHHYKKITNKDRDLDWAKSEDYVFIILKVFLERSAYHLLRVFIPYVDEIIIKNFYDYLFAEKIKRFKEFDQIIARLRFLKFTKNEKIFFDEFKIVTWAATLEEKLFNEISFWKSNDFLELKNLSVPESKAISRGAKDFLKFELEKARTTGRIRGEQISLELADRLYQLMLNNSNEIVVLPVNNLHNTQLELPVSNNMDFDNNSEILPRPAKIKIPQAMDSIISNETKSQPTESDKLFDKVFKELTNANTIEETLFNEIDFWKKHKYEKIDGISAGEQKFISDSMVAYFHTELNKARITGWIRGAKIDLDTADRLYKYILEILNEYDPNIINENFAEYVLEIDSKKEEETPDKLQRNKLRAYLLVNHPTIKHNNSLNINQIASCIVSEFFPGINGSEKKKKKESIRQELMLFKKGELELCSNK